MPWTADDIAALGLDPETGKRVQQPVRHVTAAEDSILRAAILASSTVIDKGRLVEPKPTKYHNEPKLGPDPCGGERLYPSKREARHAERLAAQKAGGEIADFFPQVPLQYGLTPDGKPLRYVADFLVVLEYRDDGTFIGRIDEPKGFRTERGTAKMGALRARGMRVRLV